MNLAHVYQALFPPHLHESLGTRLTYNSASDTIGNSGGVEVFRFNSGRRQQQWQKISIGNLAWLRIWKSSLGRNDTCFCWHTNCKLEFSANSSRMIRNFCEISSTTYCSFRLTSAYGAIICQTEHHFKSMNAPIDSNLHHPEFLAWVLFRMNISCRKKVKEFKAKIAATIDSRVTLLSMLQLPTAVHGAYN